MSTATIEQPTSDAEIQAQNTAYAERMVDLILAGEVVDQNVRAKIRRAYLFGRADQAAQNVDDLLKRVRGEAR